MVNLRDIRKGTQIYGANNQLFGTVEDVQDQYVIVNGQRYETNAFSRFENNRLFLAENYAGARNQNANEIRVPVAEEQLNVGKREVNGGQVNVHKSVVSEQVNMPVELRREEANIEKVNTPDRPLRAGEDAFREANYEIPLRAEEAVVNKEAIVTGEVVINKNQQVEQRQVADSVRKERVEVDRNDAATTARTTGYETTNRNYDNAATAATGSRGYNTQATTNYATSTGTNNFDMGQIREGYTVYGSDEDKVGKVKSVDQNGILVSRGFLQGDTYVPLNTVANITEDQIMLNVPASQIDSTEA